MHPHDYPLQGLLIPVGRIVRSMRVPCEKKRKAARAVGRWRKGLRLNDAEKELLRRPVYRVYVEG